MQGPDLSIAARGIEETFHLLVFPELPVKKAVFRGTMR
jgi:hypothetical protein